MMTGRIVTGVLSLHKKLNPNEEKPDGLVFRRGELLV